jgi:DNA excision repair protein ERCC-4
VAGQTGAAVSAPIPLLRVLCDSREQRPFPFPEGVTIERTTLGEADYSTPMLIDRVRIERKSGTDLATTLTFGRERFDREVERLKRFPHRLVIVEADLGDFFQGRIQTRMHPNALVGSLASLYARHGIPTIFAHSPVVAGRLVAGILRRLEDEYASKGGPTP